MKIVINGDVFPGREKFGIAVFNGKLYVMDGQDGSKLFDDIYYTNDGTNWVKIVTNGDFFSARSLFGTAVFDGKL